ncbi:hypothetical protein [Mucilaginibacter sp. 10B2]|uniref:hypothetical protein n=2 Tax=Mucilaginibacter TaxID=423349 RepID=UPI002B23185A|nr:hypothetical protein [Mucilaginibacter sp. 10B2]MEB0262306.1 hypothetical protein [Mucilaginibacter sp. 10I4]MEB0279953.1 hypothetical protein [Mucilaginibacter sp. 10B2]
MKYKFVLVLLAGVMLSMQSHKDDRKALLCHSWKQVAYKSVKDTLPKAVSEQMAKICSFNTDGNYEEEMYNLKSSGKWFFNSDKTKIGYVLTAFNGKPLPTFPDTTRRPNTIILKLTQDTLIYGHEAYYGPDKIYGHNDYYFVKVK